MSSGGLCVFWGCRALSGDLAFELSTRRLLEALGVELSDLRGQACCGEPIRSLSVKASCYMALRLLALAAREGHSELLVPCSKGYYMMKWSQELLARSSEVREAVEKALSSEGLELSALARPLSLLDVLHELIGPESVRKARERVLRWRVALHPGCYLLRSGQAADVLNALKALVGAAGLEAPYYPGMVDCCGGTLEVTRPDAALTLAGAKLKAACEAGLRCLVVACPACFAILDGRQEDALAAAGGGRPLPVLYLTQLLGLALGLGPEELGLMLHRSPVEELLQEL